MWVDVSDKSNLSRDKAKFVCWNTDSDGLGTNYAPNSQIQINGNIVLYAIWQTDLNSNGSSSYYTLSYDANGATAGSVPTDYTHYFGGEQITVAAQGNLSKEGCSFVAWNTKSDGTGVSYKAGTDILTMPYSNVILYAIWRDSNGNTIYDSPNTGEFDTGIQIAYITAVFSLVVMAAAVLARLQKQRCKTLKYLITAEQIQNTEINIP